MRIWDYEAGRSLVDVGLELTRGEAEELAVYLRRMLEREDLEKVHVTDLCRGLLARELTVSLEGAPTLAA